MFANIGISCLLILSLVLLAKGHPVLAGISAAVGILSVFIEWIIEYGETVKENEVIKKKDDKKGK